MQQLRTSDVFGLARNDVQVSMFVILTVSASDAATIFASWIESFATAASSSALRLTHVDLQIAELDETTIEALRRIQAAGMQVRGLSVLLFGVFGEFNGSLHHLANTTPSVQSLHLGPGLMIRYNEDDEEDEERFARGFEYRSGGPCAMVLNAASDIRIDLPCGMSPPDWLMLCRSLQLRSTRPGGRFLQIRLPALVRGHIASLRQDIRTMQLSDQPITWVRVNPATSSGSEVLQKLASKHIDGSAPIPAIFGVRSVLLRLCDGVELLEVLRSSVVLAPEAAPASITELAATEGRVGLRLQTDVCLARSFPTLLSFLETCFGQRLSSLEITIGTASDLFTSGAIASILTAFPELTCLKLTNTKLKTMDVFLNAYRADRCKLRVLSIDSGHVGFVPFFEELASPEASISKTLRELRLNYPIVRDNGDDNEDGDAFLADLTIMLTQNHSLYSLKLMVATKSAALLAKIAASLRRFHREPMALAAAGGLLPMKVRLAFLSAMASVVTRPQAKKPRTAAPTGHQSDSVGGGWWLDRGPLELVLAFAAPCELRIIRLIHEKDGRHMKAKTIDGSSRHNVTDEELVSL